MSLIQIFSLLSPLQTVLLINSLRWKSVFCHSDVTLMSNLCTVQDLRYSVCCLDKS